MGDEEGRRQEVKIRRLGWEGVQIVSGTAWESGQLFAAAGESKGIGEDMGSWEGPTSSTEDSSSPLGGP